MLENQNINKDELIRLKTGSDKIEAFLNESIKWVEKSPNVLDPTPVVKNLKFNRRRVRKVKNVLLKNPTIAFFGASQSGKSHLVKNLIQDENRKCNVLDYKRNEPIDFIKYINPDGDGNESTAIVTRFTTEKELDNSHPISIELLSPSDIVLCLCEGFLKVFKLGEDPFPKENEILEVISNIEEIEKLKEPHHFLVEDDIYFIKEYLEAYHNEKSRELLVRLDATGYWDVLAENIDRIHWTYWQRIFNVLWLDQEDFSGLFALLISNLEKLHFSKIVYADFEVVLKNLFGDYKDIMKSEFQPGNNILDVTTLTEKLYDNSFYYNIYLQDETSMKIPPGILCALGKELVFRIKETDDPQRTFLKEIDLLDFPGVRDVGSRSIKESLDNKTISYALLRGKVNYLFNSYSDNFEINNLALTSCISRQKDGAGLIPEIIDNWINNYIGKSPNERFNTLNQLDTPPLFVILSHWNEILKFDAKKDNPDPEGRLFKAFNTRFSQDLLSDKDWQSKWISQNGKDFQSFKNFYLLRDFNYCDLYSRNEENLEVAVKPERQAFFSSLEGSFLEFGEVKKYFKNPEEMWKGSSTPNNDGSELIIRNLAKITSNIPKTKRYIDIINKAFSNCLLELYNYRRTDDIGERVLAAKRDANELVTRTGLMIEEDQSDFGKMLECFIISESDIYERLYVLVKSMDSVNARSLKKYFTFLLQNPEIDIKGSDDDKLEVLKLKFGYSSTSELKDFLESELGLDLSVLFSRKVDKLKNKPSYLASEIANFWMELMQKRFSHINCQSKYIKENSLKKIGNLLRNNFRQLNMEVILSESIKDYVNNEENIPMMADILAGIINNFVMTAGWEYTPEELQAKYKELIQSNDIQIYPFSLVEDTSLNFTESNLIEIYDDMENYEDLVNTLKDSRSIEVIKRMPLLHNLFQWQDYAKLAYMSTLDKIDYDVESNEELKEIIEENEALKLAV